VKINGTADGKIAVLVKYMIAFLGFLL